MNHNYPSWEKKARRTLVDTQYLQVYKDSVKLPNGTVIDDYTVYSLPRGVVVVATDFDGKLLAQYEYKYAIDKTIINLPSGSLDKDEPILVAAARELLEETGYESSELELIITLYEHPSKSDHIMYVVRAKNAKKVADVVHEGTENISPVILLSPDDVDIISAFNTSYNVLALALTLPDFLQIDKKTKI
jgi:8-oxo-dGTP pyrophosphatase MutT (NUDIX family)